VSTLADRAIAWFDVTARDLPWRRPDTTPWGVLVSEVMLQQTPVARVTPVWLDWVHRWPDPAALAVVAPGEAIRAWGRLGYPRRALRLHACAVALVQRHAGVVPSDLADLLQLPGIGTYTARAVAAFAFGQRHPVVDTNVRRLIARAASGQPDGGPSTTMADLATVEELLPPAAARAARASIAFMELGALVCTARAPRCADCPLRRACRWRAVSASPAPGSRTAPGTPAGRGVRRSPGYAGTDRQVRGLLLGLVRDASAPVRQTQLDAVWDEPVQRERALAGLLADGLLVRAPGNRYALP
jgi:A/G-specific adenine glycosylase